MEGDFWDRENILLAIFEPPFGLYFYSGLSQVPIRDLYLRNASSFLRM